MIIDMFWMKPEGVRVWDFMGMAYPSKQDNKITHNQRERKISLIQYWKLKFYRKIYKFFYDRLTKVMEIIWIGKKRLKEIEQASKMDVIEDFVQEGSRKEIEQASKKDVIEDIVQEGSRNE
jgi:hypothetical protein